MVVCLMMLATWLLPAQNNSFAVHPFGVNEGLPSTNLSHVYKDSRNLLWISTSDMGLSIFNGDIFYDFPLITSAEMPPNFNGTITDICEDDMGRIWAGSPIGLFIIELESTTITFLPLSENKESAPLPVLALCKTSDGMIWATTNTDNIAVIDANLNVKWLTIENVIAPSQIVEGQQGNIWLGNSLDKGKIIGVDSNGQVKKKIEFSGDSNINLFKNPANEVVVCPKIGQGLMKIDEENTQLVAYQDKEYQIDSSTIQDFSNYFKSGAKDVLIQDFCFDKDGNIWMAIIGGLYVTSAKKNNPPFIIPPSLVGKNIRSFKQIDEDNFYVSANEMLDWNKKTDTLHKFFKSFAVCTYVALNENSLLLTITGDDFFILNTKNKSIEEFKPKIEDDLEFLPNNFVTLREQNGLIRSGAYYFHEPDSLAAIKNCEGEAVLKEQTVFHMIEDQEGLIWMGTDIGLLMVEGCEITKLPIETTFGYIQVNVIYELNKDELLIGSKNQGLFLYDKQKGIIKTFNQSNGLSDNRIATILSNNKERGVWIATFHGLNYIDFRTSQIHSFFEQDGIANNEFNSFASLQLNNGDLLFGGVNGCTIIPNSINFFSENAPKPSIKSYSKFDAVHKKFKKTFLEKGNKEIVLKPDERYLEFSFGSSDLINQQQNSFAYKLEGNDEKWIYPNQERTVRYTNLDAGRYKFLVKMKSPSSDWILSGNYMEVEVKEYFYQSNWFKAILISLGFSLLFLAWRARFMQKIRIEQLKQKLAYDLHDDVGSTLNGIHRIITSIKRENMPTTEIDSKLDTIAKLSDNVIDNMNDVIWSIDNKFNTFEDLVFKMQDFADDICLPIQLEFELHCKNIALKKEIDFDKRYHLLMIFKEGLNNAIKHSKGGKVIVTMENRNGDFHFQLANYSKNKRNAENSTAKGLNSIRQRTKALKASIKFETTFEAFIIDLKMKSFC